MVLLVALWTTSIELLFLCGSNFWSGRATGWVFNTYNGDQIRPGQPLWTIQRFRDKSLDISDHIFGPRDWLSQFEILNADGEWVFPSDHKPVVSKVLEHEFELEVRKTKKSSKFGSPRPQKT